MTGGSDIYLFDFEVDLICFAAIRPENRNSTVFRFTMCNKNSRSGNITPLTSASYTHSIPIIFS